MGHPTLNGFLVIVAVAALAGLWLARGQPEIWRRWKFRPSISLVGAPGHDEATDRGCPSPEAKAAIDVARLDRLSRNLAFTPSSISAAAIRSIGRNGRRASYRRAKPGYRALHVAFVTDDSAPAAVVEEIVNLSA